MIKVLSELYNATFKKNRGAAAQGFIRPTLGQYFMTHKDFTEVEMDISRDFLLKLFIHLTLKATMPRYYRTVVYILT
jgi:hypothetical protein